MIADEGPAAVGSMWMMTVIILVMATLRTYTRAFIVRSVGWDDHVFNISSVLFLLYTVFLTVAAYHGFGQDVWVLGIDEAVTAVEHEMIGISFVIIGMTLAKWSMGLFLLRIVVATWHKVLIWLAMGVLGCMSITACTLFWVQCIPSRSIYDPRVEGKCSIDISIVSYIYGTICIIVDFFFAGFPWVFIWSLNMARKDKLTIALSLSLGFFAGICGILRTMELGGFNTQNFTKDTIKLNVWSGAEMTVTMICIAIPVCRPLYKRVVYSSSYRKQSDGSDKPESHDLRPAVSNHDLASKLKLGVNGPFTRTDITRDDNGSEEQILDVELGGSVPDSIGGIRVKENVKVEWTPRMK